MEYLFNALLVLAVVTVVGHAIWVALAKLFGRPSYEKLPRRCPRCGLALIGETCNVCHWPVDPGHVRPNAREALGQLSAQVARLEQLKILDPQARASLEAVIEAERARRTPPVARPVMKAAEPAIAATLIEPPPINPAAVHSAQATPADRVAEFVARHTSTAVPPADVAPPMQSAPPAPPRASWSDWLAGFMEERNIRWGELVAGLLIVCCSIALVISFWSAIEARPWLKFLLFNGATAAIFGAGFYCEHRLRLRTTAQGMLTIGSLLAPLNFLAIAALSSAPDAGNLVTIGAEGLSAAFFAALIYFAGRVLVRCDAWLFTAGVMLPALANLLVRRFIHPGASLPTLALVAAAPTAAYLVSNLWYLRRIERAAEPSESDANALFKFLGITSFAVVLPLALLAYKTGHPILALRQLPLITALVGFVPLSAGLTLWQKLVDRGLSGLRTAGTAVAIFGAAVSLAGLVIGWPEPSALLPAAVAEFVLLSYLAWRYGMSALHLPVGWCLTAVCLLAAHLFEGRIVWSGESASGMLAAFACGETGILLAPLVVLYAGLAAVFRLRDRAEWRALGGAALTLMTASAALLVWFGYGNAGVPLGAGWILLFYAAGLLAWGMRSERRIPAWLGLGMLLLATWQLVVFRFGPSLALARAWFDALLVFATTSAALGLVVRHPRVAVANSPLRSAALHASLVVSVVAVVGALLPMPLLIAWSAWRLLWLAVLWGVIALALNRAPLGTLAQVALSAAAGFAVASVLQHQPWFASSSRPWIDPRMLGFAGLALAGVNFLWIALRALARRYEASSNELLVRAAALLRSPWLFVDRAVTGGLVALLVLLSAAAVLPGTLLEIMPASASARDFAGDWLHLGFDYTLAGQGGTWLLAAALIALVLVTLRQTANRGWLYVLVLTIGALAPLSAARFDSVGAVASALVWSSTIFLASASITVWCREPIARLAGRLGFEGWPPELGVRRDLTILVLLIGLVVPLVLGLAICAQGLGRAGTIPHLLPYYLVAAVVSTMLAAVLWVSGWFDGDGASGRTNLPLATPALAMLLGVIPLVAMVMYHIAVALVASPIRGPDPASIFGRLGYPLNYGGPIAIVAITLVGYALRQRSGSFALAASLITCLTMCVSWLTAADPILIADTSTWIHLVQLIAIVAALFTLGWIWLVAWDRRSDGRYGYVVGGPFFDVQSMIAPALAALLVGWTWLRLFTRPAPQFGAVVPPEFADAFGVATLAIVILAVWLTATALARPLSRLAISSLLVTTATVVAAIAARWDVGNWLAFRTLFVGHAITAAVLLALAWRERKGTGVFSAHSSPPAGQFWPALQTAVLFLLAVVLFQQFPWWSIAGWALCGIVYSPLQSMIYQRRGYLYAASLLINIAGLAAADQLNLVPDLPEFVYWSIALLALPVPAWLVIEQRAIRPRSFAGLNFPPAHRVAAWFAAGLLVLAVVSELSADVIGASGTVSLAGVSWLALSVVFIASASLLWDERGRDAFGLLYLVGLTACGMLVAAFDLTPPWLLWTGGMVLAAYSLATSTLWSFRARLADVASAVRIPRHESHGHAQLAWLVPANIFLIGGVILIAFLVLMTSARVDLRILIAQATLVQVASLALLARGERRDAIQHAALTVGAIGAVFFGWAWLVPGVTFTLLHALIVLAAATVIVGAFYGLGLVKLLGEESPWLSAARRLLPLLVAVSLGAILASLGIELYQFIVEGEVRIAMFATVLLGATMVAITVAALAAAILPGRDPLALSERGRAVYVYAAEILLALLFVHIRVTFPWLFRGFFQQYWPLIVMAIAFLGVGAGELFRRRQVHVLSRPLENTGVMLPVLPVLGFWFVESQVDYSLLLVGVGLLYATLSIARRSFGFGVLAALAANGGLWYFLGHQGGWGFLRHPQVWMIPPAVCVLAAAYLNRRQLNDAQMTTIRYASSMAIYLSSTADIFVNGVANAPWLPGVLAGLSVLGIFAGIILRVRAFLLLGTGFLALAMFTVIWYAAVDLEQTWIWWACGILLGLAILLLLAFFEKRRQDIHEMLDRLKQWEG